MAAQSLSGIQRPSRAINISLWVVQFVLIAIFLMAGFMKLTVPIEELSGKLPWTGQVPEGLVRFIGVVDLSGAIGLLVPAVTRIRPNLVPLAAFGIALIMVLAIVFHISRGEASVIGFNIVLFALALFVAWGRAVKAPIQPK